MTFSYEILERLEVHFSLKVWPKETYQEYDVSPVRQSFKTFFIEEK